MGNCSFVQSWASTSLMSICLRRRPALLEVVLLVVEEVLLEVELELLEVVVALVEVAELEVVLVLVEEEVHAVVDLVQVIV
jgi:hypothetical protein